MRKGLDAAAAAAGGAADADDLAGRVGSFESVTIGSNLVSFIVELERIMLDPK